MPGTDVFDEAEKQQGDVFDQAAKTPAPNLKTGAGMEAAARAQATPKPGELPGMKEAPPTGNAGTKERPLVTPKPGESFADTMGRGVEMGRHVTPEQRKSATSEAISDVPTVLGAASAPSLATGLAEGVTGGAPGLLKLGRGLIGAGVGAGLGGEAGERIAGTPGRAVGSLGGGLLGGGLAAGLERMPATSRQSLRGLPGSITPLPMGIQRFIPDWMVPTGELGSPTRPGPFSEIPARMPKVIDIPPPKPELGTPENPGWMAKLPVRMPERVSPPPELGTPENPGFMSKLPTRMPARTPEIGTPENPGFVAKLPTRMPRVVTAQSASGRPLLAGEVSSPDDLISRTRALVKPGEAPTAVDLKRAGDLTQAPLTRLRALAKFGDKLAENEINRRLRNH